MHAAAKVGGIAMHAAGSGLQGLRVRPRRWREIEELSEEIGGDRRRSWEIVGDRGRFDSHLQIDLRVPIRVEENHNVRRGEVDTHAARPRRDEEDFGGRAVRVEISHVELALDRVRLAVHA
jgi:hypothetical protein